MIDWYCFKYQLRDLFTSTSRINSLINNGIDGINLHYDWKLQSVINKSCLTESHYCPVREVYTGSKIVSIIEASINLHLWPLCRLKFSGLLHQLYRPLQLQSFLEFKSFV